MGERFEQRRDAEVPATPEEVWAAIATGPGIDSWFMGHSEVEPGGDTGGGAVRTVFGEYAPKLDITAMDAPRRSGYQHVTALIAAGQRGAAVRYFMVDGMGAPSFVPGLLRLMPGTWKKLTAVAHTLPYDATLIEPYQSAVGDGDHADAGDVR